MAAIPQGSGSGVSSCLMGMKYVWKRNELWLGDCWKNFHEVIKLFCLNGQMIFKQHRVYEIQDTTYSVHGVFFSDWITENLMEILHQTEDVETKLGHLWAWKSTSCSMCNTLLSSSDGSRYLFWCEHYKSHTRSLWVWGGGIERRAARFINQNSMGGAWKSKWAS